MTNTTVGREPVQIVEILQPLCSRTFGSSPCTASGSNDTKCYNTRATCQDTDNFALDTPLSLFFASGELAERNVDGAAYIIPCLTGVSTAPTKINMFGSNPDAKALGNRATVTISFTDFPHTDRIVDPYVANRSWNPLERGSFWTKWIARNKYRANMVVRVYEGYAGEALSSMQVREYRMVGISGPDSSGKVTLSAKDILTTIEERKAQCPVASTGGVWTNFEADSTSFLINTALLADYPSTGVVRIDDELIQYTSIAQQGDLLFVSGLTRGYKNTTPDEHEIDATVQTCVEFEEESIDSILETLLEDYGNIDASFLDTTVWATEIARYASIFNLTRIITAPTAVEDLIAEIQQQFGVYLWWEEREKLVKLKVIRGIDETPTNLNDEVNITAGSWDLKEYPRELVTQVWFYYDRRSGIADVNSPDSYRSLYIVVNTEEESPELYDETSIKTIYCPWASSRAFASDSASRIARMFRDPPRRASLKLDAKDRDIEVGDVVTLSHYLEVDAYGVERTTRWTVIQRDEPEPGHTLSLILEDTTLNGEIFNIADNAEGDYSHGTDADRYVMWITDADGEYPGNYEGAVIS